MMHRESFTEENAHLCALRDNFASLSCENSLLFVGLVLPAKIYSIRYAVWLINFLNNRYQEHFTVESPKND